MIPEHQSKDLPADAVAALQLGNKIEAIKLTRLAHNVGLKEAKERVESYLKAHPEVNDQLRAVAFGDGKSLLSWVLTIVLAIAAIVYFWPG